MKTLKILVLLLVLYSAPCFSQSDYGWYIKGGMASSNQRWNNVTTMFSEYAGLRPGVTLWNRQYKSAFGYHAGIGFTSDVLVGLYYECVFNSGRSLIQYYGADTGAYQRNGTLTLIDHSLAFHVGINFNEDFGRIAFFAGPSLNVLKLQHVKSEMDTMTVANYMFFRLATPAEPKNIDKVMHPTFDIGLNGMLGEGWGMYLQVYYAIPLIETDIIGMRNGLNPHFDSMFDESLYRAKMGFGVFSLGMFFGE